MVRIHNDALPLGPRRHLASADGVGVIQEEAPESRSKYLFGVAMNSVGNATAAYHATQPAMNEACNLVCLTLAWKVQDPVAQALGIRCSAGPGRTPLAWSGRMQHVAHGPDDGRTGTVIPAWAVHTCLQAARLV